MARIPQIGIVKRQVLDTRLRRLDEDLRIVAGASQHALDSQHLVTDRIPVAESGEDLVYRDRHSRSGLTRAASAATTGPAPSSMRTPATTLIALPPSGVEGASRLARRLGLAVIATLRLWRTSRAIAFRLRSPGFRWLLRSAIGWAAIVGPRSALIATVITRPALSIA